MDVTWVILGCNLGVLHLLAYAGVFLINNVIVTIIKFFTSRYCLCVNELPNCRLKKITELFSL